MAESRLWSYDGTSLRRGHHGRSGALLALTEFDAVNARGVRRLPAAERFFALWMVNSKGLPRNLTCSRQDDGPSVCWSRDGWAAHLANSCWKKPAPTETGPTHVREGCISAQVRGRWTSGNSIVWFSWAQTDGTARKNLRRAWNEGQKTQRMRRVGRTEGMAGGSKER